MSPELKKAIKTASSRKCQKMAAANSENLKFLLEDDLRVLTQGGTSIMTAVFGSSYPVEIEKIRSAGYIPPITPPPAGWNEFLTLVRDTHTVEARCFEGMVPADLIAWSKGKNSMFAGIVNEATRKVEEQKVAIAARLSPRFKTFEEARAALTPLVSEHVAFKKGNILVVKMKIIRILKAGQFLMTNYPAGSPKIAATVYAGVITPEYEGDRTVKANAVVEIVGELSGTYAYTSPSKAKKTAPKVTVYGIKASE